MVCPNLTEIDHGWLRECEVVDIAGPVRQREELEKLCHKRRSRTDGHRGSRTQLGARRIGNHCADAAAAARTQRDIQKRNPEVLAQSLIGGEEESLVLLDRTAKRASEVVALELRIASSTQLCRLRSKVIAGIQGGIA